MDANEPFWAPLDVRDPQRAHLWTRGEGIQFKTRCGLAYQSWDVGAPDDAMLKCQQCVRKLERE